MKWNLYLELDIMYRENINVLNFLLNDESSKPIFLAIYNKLHYKRHV